MSGPRYEVEVKFPISNPDGVRARLAELGAVWSAGSRQVDCYFAHPVRSFPQTDEALRTRTVGNVTTLTYKGPVIDRQTKTRREIEVNLLPGPDSSVALTEILELLGFPAVREVVKTRQAATFIWRDQAITCGWDEVPTLGTFLELEIVTDEAGRPAAQACLLDLVRRLELPDQEHRSYLAMLLARDSMTAR